MSTMELKEHSKVMQNFTICLPKKIRKQMEINVKDTVILFFKEGKLTIQKAPSDWLELARTSPKVFEKYGGGEKYLKKEREGWYE